MSRGPGVRQRFLQSMLEHIDGFFLADICETRSDEQAFWRAVKTGGIPYRNIPGFKSGWIGTGNPLYEPRSEEPNFGRGWNAKNSRMKWAKGRSSSRDKYEESLYQAVLSVEENTPPKLQVCRHLESQREAQAAFWAGAAKFFSDKTE